jgi:hypothetical protein
MEHKGTPKRIHVPRPEPRRIPIILPTPKREKEKEKPILVPNWPVPEKVPATPFPNEGKSN